VAGLNEADLASLDTWRQFYHTEYSYIGLLAGGRFYDTDGTPLEAVALVQVWGSVTCPRWMPQHIPLTLCV
jgi:hypothetical protein